MTSMNVSLTDERVRIIVHELKLACLKEALAPGIRDWQEGRFADHSLPRIKQALDAQ